MLDLNIGVNRNHHQKTPPMAGTVRLLAWAIPAVLILSGLTGSAASDKTDAELYHSLGLPFGAPVSDVKRTYKALALKWHPDKWFSDGGAFEGVHPAELDEKDEAHARKTWYTIQEAGERLGDAERKTGEAPPGSDGILEGLRASFGSSWGDGCHNNIAGCPGLANAAPQSISSMSMGTASKPEECLLRCHTSLKCVSWTYIPSKRGSGAGGECLARKDAVWDPVQKDGAVAGYCPTWQRKYHSGGYGETSLLGTCIGLFRFALDKAISDWTWLAMIVGVAALVKGVMVTADRMGRRTREKLAAEREAYRQDELRRIKEEVDERKRQKEITKELKRQRFENEELSRVHKESQAQMEERLLRERMQGKYAELEERKRPEREAKEREEREKRLKKKDDEMAKKIPQVFRGAVQGTGTYLAPGGEQVLVPGTRLGGAVEAGGVPRADAGRGAVERLDAAVVQGVTPDADTLAEIEAERRRQEARERQQRALEEYGRYVPSVYRDAGGDLTGFMMGGEGEEEEAGAAAGAAAETRRERAEEEGELEEGRRRAAGRRDEEREREKVMAEKKKAIDRKAAPDVFRAAEGGRTLGGGGGGEGAKQGTSLPVAGEGDQVHIKCTDASNKREPVTLSVPTGLVVREIKELVASKLGDGTVEDQIRLVFAGRVLPNGDFLSQVIGIAKSRLSSRDSPLVFHMVVGAPR